jgi:hypothetical protein
MHAEGLIASSRSPSINSHHLSLHRCSFVCMYSLCLFLLLVWCRCCLRLFSARAPCLRTHRTEKGTTQTHLLPLFALCYCFGSRPPLRRQRVPHLGHHRLADPSLHLLRAHLLPETQAYGAGQDAREPQGHAHCPHAPGWLVQRTNTDAAAGTNAQILTQRAAAADRGPEEGRGGCGWARWSATASSATAAPPSSLSAL